MISGKGLLGAIVIILFVCLCLVVFGCVVYTKLAPRVYIFIYLFIMQARVDFDCSNQKS